MKKGLQTGKRLLAIEDQFYEFNRQHFFNQDSETVSALVPLAPSGSGNLPAGD